MTNDCVRQDSSTEARITDPDIAERKLAPGFVVRRRLLLWLSTLTASALLFDTPAAQLAQKSMGSESRPLEPGEGPERPYTVEVGWDEFVKNGVPEIKQLYKDASPRGQDAYLFALANWAARIRLDTLPRAKVYPFAGLNPPVNFGVSYKGVPFMLVEWWLEPGATLPPHNHPNYGVCTLGIEGEAHIRNFEVVGDAPDFSSKEVFHVRETHSETMSRGRINSLSPTRDNIHTFKAGKAGARGVDIGTLYGVDRGFSFLNIEDKPKDAGQRIFEATWLKF